MEKEVKPTGKEAILAILKTKNPKYEPENDEQLMSDFHDHHQEIAAELENHRSTNAKLAEHITKDPRNGAMFSMMAEGKSTPYIMGKVFGNDMKNLEGQDAEEFEAGYQEQLTQLAKSKQLQEQASANFEKSDELISKVCSDNQLDESKSSEIREAIMEYAEDLLMGNIPESLILEIIKGKNYDQDVQEAAETGKVEGLNQKVDMVTKPKEIIPDMGTKTIGNKLNKRPLSPLERFKSGV